MSDFSKAQTYYKVRVWFKTFTKTYHIHNYEGLEKLLDSFEANDTVLYYMVEKIQNFIYPNYNGRFKKLR